MNDAGVCPIDLRSICLLPASIEGVPKAGLRSFFPFPTTVTHHEQRTPEIRVHAHFPTNPLLGGFSSSKRNNMD